MNKEITQKELSLSLTLVLSLNLSANLLGLYRYSYDAYTHIFFASHYMRDWVNLWEPRWYGGFPITSYPPLTHQLTALLGFLIGAEASYQIMCTASAVMLVFALYKASAIFIDRSETKYVAVAASLLPSIYLTLYVYGQLPTILAASISFLAAYAFHNFLSSGRRKDLAYTAILSVLVASSHHFTFVFFFPILLTLAFLMAVTKREVSFKAVSKRLLTAFVVSAFLILLIMEPFFESLMKTPLQAEIPHGSRGNIFTDFSHSLLFFWGVHGFTIALIPVGFLIATRRLELTPLFATFIFLFVMGLGAVTPIPKLILGRLWYVLTYDRFAIWASFLYAFFLGIMLKDAGQIIEKYYSAKDSADFIKIDRTKLRAGLIIGLAASSIFTISLDGFLTPPPIPDPVLEEVASFLEENGDYRYITFGFGQSIMKLSAICSSETVDGGYNSARRLPIFVSSGVERVDNAKFFPNSTNFLSSLLNQSADLGIKWAIVADGFYTPILQDHEYELVNATLDSNPLIDILTRDDVKMKEIQSKDSFNLYQIIVWGFGPISALTAALALYVKGFFKNDEKAKHT